MYTVHIFISHSWSYSDSYKKLKTLLSKDDAFKYVDYSIPKDNPVHEVDNDKELREAIKNKMARASVVLILAGVYSTYSKWINAEVEIAKNEFYYPKTIIAIEPWGAERTSAFVKNNADMVVGWNTKSIVEAIKRFHN